MMTDASISEFASNALISNSRFFHAKICGRFAFGQQVCRRRKFCEPFQMNLKLSCVTVVSSHRRELLFSSARDLTAQL